MKDLVESENSSASGESESPSVARFEFQSGDFDLTVNGGHRYRLRGASNS